MADTSTPKHASTTTTWAKWLIVVLLAAVAAAGLVELGRTSYAAAAGPDAMAGAAGGIYVVAAQIARDAYGVYLVDPESGTICVYQYQPANRRLRLLASRNFTYDLQLDDYNTAPLPREIKELVDQQRRLGRAEESSQPTSSPVEE